MRVPTTLIAWLAGIALLGTLLALNNPFFVFDRIAGIAWWLPLIVAWHAVPLSLDARAWQMLFQRRPPLPRLMGLIWIGEGANGLLPVPHLGEVLRARLAARLGRSGEGVGSVVVDLTLGVSTELVFALIGLALFSTLPHSLGALRYLVPALALVAGAALAFIFLQRAGLFTLAGRIARHWSAEARVRLDPETIAALDDGVRAIYRHRRRLVQSATWRLAGWIGGTGETWLVFRAMGHPIPLGEAVILESLGHVARTAVFFIPGGLGIEDAAFFLLGSALGLGPDAGLVLALVKRLRELVLGLPALAAGYLIEARRLLRGDTARIES
ncbi:MAG: lysylphosphatidylglycerol synthase domain-containing protein [Stellaceae bacterium]